MDFYKDVMKIIYRDSLLRRDGFINSVFHGSGSEVLDPRFIGQGAYAKWFAAFLNAVGVWCAENENKNTTLPESFLPEYNPNIGHIMNPDLEKLNDSSDTSEDLA